jgi:hypothetical protein
MNRVLAITDEQLRSFCRRNQIARLSLFGSALRDEMREDSDIDLLVEFQPGAEVSLLDLAGMEIELTEALGQKVDLRTPAELSRYFRDEVLAAAEVLYAA